MQSMDKKKGHILIVDDDEDILIAGRLLVKRHFERVTTCNDPQALPNLIEQHQYDAILLDMNFGPGESTGKQGFFWLQRMLEINPELVVIMLTAHGGVNVAVKAMKLGATDFVAKPWDNEKMIATLSTAVQLGQSRQETHRLRQANQILTQSTSIDLDTQLLGQSEAMHQVKELVSKSAPTDANVLILGENGTGKELIARRLHQQSLRHNKIFMPVDLGAISESLFESELFGHKKGAFTGANEDRVGRFQAADGGTIFLDEIGNLPLFLQAKLLTVLEQRKVIPLGSNTAVEFDVRVIAATNLDISRLKDDRHFRQDLLFRLNTVEVTLPPLRQRTQDILPIATFYIDRYCRKYGKPIKTISPSASIAMEQYPWPGNVRALRHAIERAVILSDGDTLTEVDFQLSSEISHLPSNDIYHGAQPLQYEADKSASHTKNEQDLNLERLEKQTIVEALKRHRYNISHTAKALGLTRAALYRRMEKHGV
ncbi:MAG: sigma-54 dependent transcriptional regulator [Aliiglaciecola sp.]